MTEIQTKRVYADPAGSAAADGYRIFVDRLWPRGESKQEFHYDLWAKDVAPSTALREWYHQDREDRWPEFQKKYRAELAANPVIPGLLSEIRRHPLVTILYGSKDPVQNQAVILADYLREHL